MTFLAVNLDEVENFITEVKKLREKIQNDSDFKKRISESGDEYERIKSYFIIFARYLKYVEKIEVDRLYRVRPLETSKPHGELKELIYPETQKAERSRMNNSRFRVLYVAFNEFTAIAENGINSNHIGQHFQLTRFNVAQKLNVYNLGMFSKLFLNHPRDCDYVNEAQKYYFGTLSDSALRGFASLENAFTDVLYSKEKDSHLLSSILADAIFTTNKDVDGIIYPSLQNFYGINLALKKDAADQLKVAYTSSNILTKAYSNGFYKYETKSYCDAPVSEPYDFEKITGTSKYVYR